MGGTCICRAKLLALGCTTVTAPGVDNDKLIDGQRAGAQHRAFIHGLQSVGVFCRSSPSIFTKVCRGGPELDC